MKRLILIMIFLCTNIFLSKASAQDDQFQRQVEEIMKAREEMLRSLLEDNGDMEQKMLEMMKRFSQSGGMPGFDIGELEGPVVGEYDWIVTDTHKTLKIKVTQIKDRPLDIKISGGMIKIKGDVESTQGAGKKKVVRKVNFERSFSLPDDIDQTSPEFENRDGEFLIKFKRLEMAKFKKTKLPASPSKKSDERIPVGPNSEDLNI